MRATTVRMSEVARHGGILSARHYLDAHPLPREGVCRECQPRVYARRWPSAEDGLPYPGGGALENEGTP